MAVSFGIFFNGRYFVRGNFIWNMKGFYSWKSLPTRGTSGSMFKLNCTHVSPINITKARENIPCQPAEGRGGGPKKRFVSDLNTSDFVENTQLGLKWHPLSEHWGLQTEEFLIWCSGKRRRNQNQILILGCLDQKEVSANC